VQQAVVFRGRAEAPDGEQWLAYSPRAIVVYPGEGDSDPPYKPAGPDYCGYYPDEPGDTTTGGDAGSTGGDSTGGATTGDASTGGEASTSGTADTGASDDGGSSCSCGAGRGAPHPWGRAAWLSVFALLAMRRRQRAG
jgi:MYXO-CTERM domain-containing protein